MKKLDQQQIRQIKEVNDRVATLARCNLDPAIWSVLEVLNRQTCFTQVQLDLLSWAEEKYGIKNHVN